MKSRNQYVFYFLLGIFVVNGCTLRQTKENVFQDLEYQQIKDIASSSNKYFLEIKKIEPSCKKRNIPRNIFSYECRFIGCYC